MEDRASLVNSVGLERPDLVSLFATDGAGAERRKRCRGLRASAGWALVLHAVLALLAWWAAVLTWGNRIAFMVAWSLSISHAVLDELYQNRLPGRDANLEDVVYNLVGVFAALFVVWLWQRRKEEEL